MALSPGVVTRHQYMVNLKKCMYRFYRKNHLKNLVSSKTFQEHLKVRLLYTLKVFIFDHFRPFKATNKWPFLRFKNGHR